MISVPNVTGQTLAGAQRALTAAGLVPGAAGPQTSPTIPQGEVISTDPPAGTSWPQTRPIKLTVSAGIGLPDFTGQPRQAAEQWLQQHQLQVQEQATNEHHPAAGQRDQAEPGREHHDHSGRSGHALHFDRPAGSPDSRA